MPRADTTRDVGIESRDWYRERPKQRHRQVSPLLLVVGAIVVGAALMAVTPTGRRALGLGDAQAHPGGSSSPVTATGGGEGSLYPVDDPWQRYLASDETCPGGERTDLPVDLQVQAMVCLIDYARRQDGLDEPRPTTLLSSTALQKADEIVRCQNFAHAPCGASPDADVRATGFEGEFGENLYIAEGSQGAPRVALDGWLNSPEHRENLFRPEWQTQGIAAIKLAAFGPYRDATLWVSHFAT